LCVRGGNRWRRAEEGGEGGGKGEGARGGWGEGGYLNKRRGGGGRCDNCRLAEALVPYIFICIYIIYIDVYIYLYIYIYIYRVCMFRCRERHNGSFLSRRCSMLKVN